MSEHSSGTLLAFLYRNEGVLGGTPTDRGWLPGSSPGALDLKRANRLKGRDAKPLA